MFSIFHDYRLTFMALLWFPPVGLNHYSNPLKQLRLQFMLITWILTSWIIFKIFHGASNITTLHLSYRFKLMINYLMLIILDLGVNLTLLLVAFTCGGIHNILELGSDQTWIPLSNSSSTWTYLSWTSNPCILAFYILLNHTNACSSIFLLKKTS
jgi:hypothetical protein